METKTWYEEPLDEWYNDDPAPDCPVEFLRTFSLMEDDGEETSFMARATVREPLPELLQASTATRQAGEPPSSRKRKGAFVDQLQKTKGGDDFLLTTTTLPTSPSLR